MSEGDLSFPTRLEADAWPQVRHIVTTLRAARRELVDDTEAALRQAMGLAQGTVPDLAGVAAIHVDRGLDALEGHRAPTADDLDALASLGRLSAREHIPVEALLAAHTAAARRFWVRFVAAGHRLPHDVEVAVLEAVWLWADVVSRHVAAEHRRTELEVLRRQQGEQSAFVRGLLSGTLAAEARAARLPGYGLRADVRYRALHARISPPTTAADVEAALRSVGGVVTSAGADLVGLVPQPPRALPAGVLLATGPAVPLDELPSSAAVATRVLEAAARFGVTGVYDLDRLGLRLAVAEEDQLGQLLERQFLEPLSATSSGRAVLETAEVYLEEGRRTDDAARRLFVHPNTVRYRLRALSKQVGLDLESTDDVVVLWWVLQRRSMRTVLAGQLVEQQVGPLGEEEVPGVGDDAQPAVR